MIIIEIIQKFFLFLSRDNGLLFTRSVEFLIFTFIAYIVVSEYLKRRTTELKVSSIAFLLFSIDKLFMTIFLSLKLFGGINISSFEVWLPLVDHFLESLALVVLANAIIYPSLKSKIKKNTLLFPIIGLCIVYLIAQLLWYLELYFQPGGEFHESLLFFAFLIIKSSILLFPLYLSATVSKKEIRYRFQIFAALLIYLLTQFLSMFNYLFYESGSGRLLVATHPFPVLSAIIFFRVVFLRAADTQELHQQLRNYEQKLKHEHELSTMKDELVSVVSHELRTPLTSISLYTDLMLKGKFGLLSKKQKKAFKIMKGEEKKLSHLIEDNLTLSRLESGKTKLSPIQCNLHSLAEKYSYQELADKKKIRIINRIPKEFTLVIDPSQFTQVITNLLSNAIKYTEEEGEIFLDANETEDSWQFSVTDTGIGIPKEKIPHLFDKFYQIESYMTRITRGGTGLGLAIVKKIVELHNGKITVESRVGRGSKFSVVIPKKSNA